MTAMNTYVVDADTRGTYCVPRFMTELLNLLYSFGYDVLSGD
jgi:hypothetical protein